MILSDIEYEILQEALNASKDKKLLMTYMIGLVIILTI